MRVCFILGNLSSDDTSCWEQLAFTHSALTILEGLIEKYFTREVTNVYGKCVDCRVQEKCLILF